MHTRRLIPLISGLMLAHACILAQNVTITPLGARSGEFCSPDRALLFEDPTGVRILYDPGMTVAGGTDPRLGNVDAVLVTHAHGDHLGSAKLNQDPSASGARCDSQAAMTPTGNSNAAEIAAAKHSAVIVSSELASFLNGKIQGILGVPISGCPTSGPTNELLLPLSQPCTGNIGHGAKRTIRNAGATKGVKTGFAAGTVAASGELFAQSGTLTPGDAAILRFLAAAEIIETDFWIQYNELGGIQDSEVPGGTGSDKYIKALQVLDADMPQYIHTILRTR